MAADDPSGQDDPGPAGGGPAPATLGFDTSVAHPARIWDYFLGGKDNFAADRAAAQGVLEVMPTMAMVARAGRAFLAAAVHYLATSGDVSQFLDIGTGLPTANNKHEVAQRANQHARIVYVDSDPIVLMHAGRDQVQAGVTPLGQWAPGAAAAGPAHLPTYTALACKP